ncbi:MAG: hypothetical protein ABJG68_13765 [Crocinitomicaceae bacterium]
MKCIAFVAFLLVFESAMTQEKEKGNVNIHVGTMLFYNTISLGYESFDFTKNLQKLQVRGNVKTGLWSASILDANLGFQSAAGISFLYGNNHKIEFSNDIVFHFDKSIKHNGMTYIATTYRPFIGYRFQNPEKKLILKLGVGWREVFQCGIGFKI